MILSVVLVSLALLVLPSLAQSSPEDVAKALIAAEGSHNVDTAVSLFADDAVVTLPTGVMDTTDAIRAWQQELADENFRIEPVGRYVDGNTVTWNGDISLDRFRQMGIASLASTWKLVIEDGKVKTFDFTFTPEAQKALAAAAPAS